MFTRVLGAILAGGLLASCGPAGPSIDGRHFGEGRHTSYRRMYDGQIKSEAGCKHTWKTGCLAGQIVVSPRVFLDGVEYFDVESMGKDLPSLIKVTDAKGVAKDKSSYDVVIDPEITNDNFKRGFAVFVKGSPALDAKVDGDGSFQFNDLLPGSYEVRVQRQFSLKVVERASVAQPLEGTEGAEAQVEPVTEVNESAYCLTIYADKNRVDIERDEGTALNFDDFNLHIVEKACSAGRSGFSLTKE